MKWKDIEHREIYCPNCGKQMGEYIVHYDDGASDMVCSYCGFRIAIEDELEIDEGDSDED